MAAQAMECQSTEARDPLAKRRLILFLDGTWNDPETSDADTNIVRLRDLLARRFANDWAPPTIAQAVANDSSYNMLGIRHSGGFDYLVFYERGVGTGPALDRFTGGIFGHGLDRNVRRAYKFCSRHYRAGDEIFVFGFSRGAYTARSLVGYIGASGLLTAEHCDEERERLAWSYYRTSPNDRLPGTRVRLEPFVHPFEQTRIACLGVFDTVGALGIPTTLMLRINREAYQFHDVELSPVVRLNLHALAIDERRPPFAASVFRRSRFRWSNSIIEQAWFPGVHADIGGGYVDEYNRRTGALTLDDVTLDWMIKRVSHHYPDFPSLSLGFPPLLGESKQLSVQHDSRQWQYRLYRSGVRAIGNRRPKLGTREICVSYDRGEAIVGETVHVSALERLGQNAPCGSIHRLSHYLPSNLIEVLPDLYAKYCSNIDLDWPANSLSVTSWNGENVLDSRSATHVAGDVETEKLSRLRAEILAALDRLEALGIRPVVGRT